MSRGTRQPRAIADAARAVAWAREQADRHAPYVYGAHEHSGAFDCSLLVQLAERRQGLALPRTAHEQAEWFRARGGLYPATRENVRRLRSGDEVFWYGSLKDLESITHCALYAGRDRRGVRIVIAAVDQNYGVLRHRMRRFLAPLALGFVNHS